MIIQAGMGEFTSAELVPGTISLAQTDNQAGIAIFGGVFVLIAVLGLLVSVRVFFPQKQEL